MPETYNINDWINPSLDNPPEDAITEAPLNTYNGSEYVINGVTYRNLEAQVKYNQDNGRDLSDRIDETNARIADVEEQIPFCVKHDSSMVCDKTMGEIIEAKNNGAYVYISTANASNTGYFTVSEIRTNGTKHYFNAYVVTGDAVDPYIYFLSSDQCEDDEYPTLTFDESYQGSSIYWCTHGQTTDEEIQDALDAGQLPALIYNGNLYIYYWTTSGYRYFMSFVNNTHSRIMMTQASSTWGGVTNLLMEQTSNKVTSISSTSTDSQYPSAKCVYDQLLTKQPNLFYECTYGTTTFANITDAIDDGLIPIVRYNNVQYYYSHKATSSGVTYHYFTCDYYTTLRYVRCRETTNAWSSSSTTALTTANKKSTPQTSASYYPDFSYINTYERMLVVGYTHGTNVISSTFADITTANTNGRKIQMVDNLGTVYQLAYISASKIIFSSCYMGAADADITCENISITSSNTITYYTNMGG